MFVLIIPQKSHVKLGYPKQGPQAPKAAPSRVLSRLDHEAQQGCGQRVQRTTWQPLQQGTLCCGQPLTARLRLHTTQTPYVAFAYDRRFGWPWIALASFHQGSTYVSDPLSLLLTRISWENFFFPALLFCSWNEH